MTINIAEKYGTETRTNWNTMRTAIPAVVGTELDDWQLRVDENRTTSVRQFYALIVVRAQEVVQMSAPTPPDRDARTYLVTTAAGYQARLRARRIVADYLAENFPGRKFTLDVGTDSVTILGGK